MADKKIVGVFIGRVEPFHNGHLDIFKEIRKRTDRIIIVIGSSHQAPSPRNPWSSHERELMMTPVLYDLDFDGWDFVHQVDRTYSNTSWAAEVQDAVSEIIGDSDYKPVLFGHEKDKTSFYLKTLFLNWECQLLPAKQKIDATSIRDEIFSCQDENGNLNLSQETSKLLPHSSLFFINNYGVTEEYKNMCDYSRYVKNYKKTFEVCPYPPTFVTADAVVVCGGNILLVKRKAHPGKGLFAMPGGFLNQDEWIREGILRELVEETEIRVSTKELDSSIKQIRTFDAPNRSERGRIITHAGLIVLKDRKFLPRVKGSDDADPVGTGWVPLDKFYNMPERMFEDHYSIINFMLDRIS